MADAITVEDIDAGQLSDWLVGQRWFASKAREVQVHPLALLPLSDEPAVSVALVEARFASGTHDLYQLLVGRGPDGQILLDVLRDPTLGGVLVRLLAEQREVGSEHGAVAFHWVAGALAPHAGLRSLDAEQSNTSALIDDRYVLKLFRRLEPGPNPELEMLRFLAERGFAHVPSLAGWYELRSDVLDATLGVAQGFLADSRDGWDLVLDGLADGRAAGLVDELGELGAVLAQLHNTLASDRADPDFVPEPFTQEALALLAATVDAEIDRAFVDLTEAPDPDVVADLVGRGEEVRDRLRGLSSAPDGGLLIRHHGDLHLGQTMRSPDRWIIIDFEGEPARSLHERRRKRSPLRDVAGMLRSFAYAASAVVIQRRVQVPAGWEGQARAAFLERYLAEVQRELLPAGPQAVERLLAVFELEKAVYELGYELNHRPDWAGSRWRGSCGCWTRTGHERRCIDPAPRRRARRPGPAPAGRGSPRAPVPPARCPPDHRRRPGRHPVLGVGPRRPLGGRVRRLRRVGPHG